MICKLNIQRIVKRSNLTRYVGVCNSAELKLIPLLQSY